MNTAALRRMSHLYKINDNSIYPNNNFEMNENALSSNPTEYCVYLRNATKSYGFKYNKVSVFNNLNATIAKGEIYALMGASGCGKTTLLSCILGTKKLNYGKIWILGGTPGTKNSRVPGPSVGFMPQETALYISFTIEETLLYFGWIAGMTTDQIKQKTKFLKQLLTLDHTNEIIGNLSGGEQRRVSLAVALVHEPELLVLDEPTVGIDPIIRKTVWSYLTQLAIEKNITIIITTHYIEEARQAHTVALMRYGTLLAEEPPDTLIQRFGGTSLEDTFLKLSVIQNKNFVTLNGSQADQYVAKDINGSKYRNELPAIPLEGKCEKVLTDFVPNFNRNRIKALLFKGFLWMFRNLSMMAFSIILPLVLITLFYYSLGRNFEDLPVAIINQETHNMKNCDSFLTCNSTQLSCCYTKYLEIQSIKLVYYETEEEAVQSVSSGKSYASIAISENYTKALRSRIENKETTTPWDLRYSEIDVFRDVSNKIIATFLKKYLYETFMEFLQDYMEICGNPRKTLQEPINFEDPVHGVMKINFTDAALPSFALVITFNLAVLTTSILMLTERKEGTLQRTYVIGIIDEELLLAHFICEFCITLTQIILTIFGAFFLFSMTMKGSLILVFIICCLSGICGMCFGLFISCICDQEITAGITSTGCMIASLLICGVLWPLESVHYLLKPFTYLLPFTTAVSSLRNILHKGWNLSMGSVYIGFFSFGIWSLILIIASMVLLKFKK